MSEFDLGDKVFSELIYLDVRESMFRRGTITPQSLILDIVSSAKRLAEAAGITIGEVCPTCGDPWVNHECLYEEGIELEDQSSLEVQGVIDE